jgi:hypothetical protein
MDGLPTACSRVMRAINNGQGDKVTVYGFATSVELSLFMASYSSATTTGSRYRLPPTTTYKDSSGKPYVAYGQPSQAGEAAVQYVIAPGFQLGFEPNPQNPGVDARPGGSSAGKPLYSQKQINAAVDNCAQSYFSIRLDSFDPTSPGHNGTFNGTDVDTNFNVTVVNDVRTFSMAGIGRLRARIGGGPSIPIVGGTPVGAEALGFSPYRNYTGNDVRGGDPVVRGISYQQGTQIWELGNSLDAIKPHNRGPSGEAGPWFLNCVNTMLKAHIGGFNK